MCFDERPRGNLLGPLGGFNRSRGSHRASRRRSDTLWWFGLSSSGSKHQYRIACVRVGRAFEHQSEWDSNLIAIDGSSQKSRLGANAILAASLAFARAQSHLQRIPLHQYFSQMAGYAKGALPQLTVNLFSGGRHAGVRYPCRTCCSFRKVNDRLTIFIDGGIVYQAAVRLIDRKYQMRLLRADEGGLAPPFPDAQSMLDDAVECIAAAGWEPMREIAIAVDVASSHFYEAGQYRFGQEDLSSSEMVERLAS